MRWVICACFFLFFGCADKKIPKEVMQPNELKVIVWDMIAADEISSDEIIADTTIKLFGTSIKNYKKVLQIHRLSKEEFFKNLRYYEEHPDHQKVLYDSVMAYANRLKALPPSKKAEKKDSTLQTLPVQKKLSKPQRQS